MSPPRRGSRRCLTCRRRLPARHWQIVAPTGATFATCSAPCMRTLVTAAESLLSRWLAQTIVPFPSRGPTRPSAIDERRPFPLGALEMARADVASGVS